MQKKEKDAEKKQLNVCFSILWSLLMINACCYNISKQMNIFKEINIKNCAYYFFDNIINIKDLDRDNIKVDEKSYRSILIYYIGYVTKKSLKPLYLIIHKTKQNIEEINGNKYLTLVLTDEN